MRFLITVIVACALSLGCERDAPSDEPNAPTAIPIEGAPAVEISAQVERPADPATDDAIPSAAPQPSAPPPAPAPPPERAQAPPPAVVSPRESAPPPSPPPSVQASIPPPAESRTASAPGVPTEDGAAPSEFEFSTLEARLRDTKALGVFTKLELKNQIDKLLARVRDYHQRGRGDLAQIRESFDLLVMKVLALLQEKEADLATEISRARPELWSILADPQRFAKLEAT